MLNVFQEAFFRMVFKQVANELSLGKKIEEVNIQFHLTKLKLLHAKQQLKFYNRIMSEGDAEMIVNGWKASGIYNIPAMRSSALPSFDPFQGIFFFQ